MGLTSHISCVYDAFSSYHVSFSLMTSLTMMGLDPGHLVRSLYIFSSDNSVGRVSGSVSEKVKCSFPFFDGEMVNSFFDGEMGKVGQVTEIFSKVGGVTETFSRPKTFTVSNSFYVFASLTLSTVTSSISCLDARQLEPFVKLSTLVVEPMTDLSLSVVL